jgi:hypothetical protein
MGEMVRTAVREHLRGLVLEVRERNDLLAYYRENRQMRQRGGYVP